MKIKFLTLTLLLLASLVLVSVNTYAHFPRDYARDDIKTEAKKIDKGIQLTITSDDPEVAKEIQENSRYYEEMLADNDYCPHMGRNMAHHRSGCW